MNRHFFNSSSLFSKTLLVLLSLVMVFPMEALATSNPPTLPSVYSGPSVGPEIMSDGGLPFWVMPNNGPGVMVEGEDVLPPWLYANGVGAGGGSGPLTLVASGPDAVPPFILPIEAVNSEQSTVAPPWDLSYSSTGAVACAVDCGGNPIGGHPLCEGAGAAHQDPVYLLTGAKMERAVDLVLPCPGVTWSSFRSYDSQMAGDARLGNKWMSTDTDMILYQVSGGLDLVTSASFKTYLEGSDGAGYTGPPMTRLTATHESADDHYKLVNETTGAVAYFHDFTVTPAAKRGKLKEFTSHGWEEAGKSGLVYTYNGDGSLNSIMTSTGQEYSIVFSHNNDLVTQVVVYAGDPMSADQIMKVAYTYKDGTHHSNVGQTNDLVQVKTSVKDSTGTWVDSYTQYRYDDSNSRLEGVFNHRDLVRLKADGGYATMEEILEDPDSEEITTGVELEDYASKWIEYYTSSVTTSHTSADMTYWASGGTGKNLQAEIGCTTVTDLSGRVKEQRIGSSSCGSCGSVSTVKFYYLEHAGHTDDNEVSCVVIRDSLDSAESGVSRVLTGVNSSGLALRSALTPDPYDSPKYWCTSARLTETSVHETTNQEEMRWRVTERRSPAAHQAINGANLDEFLDPYDASGSSWTNDTSTLRSSSQSPGATLAYTYSTTGRLTEKRIRLGHNGDANLVESYVWGSTTPVVPDKYLTRRFIYPTSTTTAATSMAPGDTESYLLDYEFWDSDKNVAKKLTVTPPVVPTAENGSNTASTLVEYFDKTGRKRWKQNGEEYITYYSYNKSNGKLAYTVTDANPGGLPTNATDTDLVGQSEDNNDGSDNAPSRPGSLPTALGLDTKLEFDNLGRAVLLQAPGGDRHSAAYEADRTIVFPYLDSTTNVPQMPVGVAKRDEFGRVSETFRLKIDWATTGSIVVSEGRAVGIDSENEPDQEDYIYWKRTQHHDDGKTQWVDRYHDIPASGYGDLSDDFVRTAFLYDTLGRGYATIQQVSGEPAASGVEQVTKLGYDALGRVEVVYRGVSDSGHNIGADYTNLPTDMAVVAQGHFDGATSSTLEVGDGRLTRIQVNHEVNGSQVPTESTEVNLYYDAYGRLRGSERLSNGTTSIGPYAIRDVDWRGRTTATATYTVAPASWDDVVEDAGYVAGEDTDRFGLRLMYYDSRGRAYRTFSYPGTETTKHFQSDYYYDRNDRLVATGSMHSAMMEYAYDGAGRRYQSRTVGQAVGSYSSGAYSYVAPAPAPAIGDMPAAGDAGLVAFSHAVFDNSGNVTQRHGFEMNFNDANGIDIDSTSSYVRSSVYAWYDDLDRIKTVANYGSGDGNPGSNSHWKYTALPGSVSEPSASTVAIQVAKYGYDTATGRAETVTTWRDASTPVVNKSFYDDLGRRTSMVADFDAGSGGIERTTSVEYNGLSAVVKLTAENGANDQVTDYFYLDKYNASLLTHTIYPDASSRTPETTWATEADQVRVEHHLDGSVKRRQDQRGVEIEYGFDNARRVDAEYVESFGSTGDVDVSVLSITRKFDELGRMTHVTSHSTKQTTGDGGMGAPNNTNAVNQIAYSYDPTLGLLTESEQEHAGAVDGSTPSVQYGYDVSDSSNVYSNGLRLSKVTYPDGRLIHTTYDSSGSLNDLLHRVHKLEEDSFGSPGADLTSYQYNGVGRLVETRLESSTPVHSHDDKNEDGVFGNWDRFGRAVYKPWLRADVAWDDSHLREMTSYAYDLAGNRQNRLVRLDRVPGGAGGTDIYDQVYTHDNLGRLTNVKQGTDTGKNGSINSLKFEQDWTLDRLGNWSDFNQDDDGASGFDLEQTRSHNKANEIDNGSGNGIATTTGDNWADPAYDPAGNMTTMPKPKAPTTSYAAKYDAWNRLVSLYNDQVNEYDGLHRRIKRDETEGSGDATHFYYNRKWQCLEERQEDSIGQIDTAPTRQYVWHPHYIDALAVSYDMVAHYLGKKNFYLHDANFNVTAALDDTGDVVERYTYNAYGKVTYLEPDFEVGNQWSSIGNEHLYTGRRTDPETGLQLNRYRYYHQQLGRWVNRDPIGYAAGDMNLYAYVGGMPTYYVDPSGELAFLIPILGGALIGAAEDIFWQLIIDGTPIHEINWWTVGSSAALGAALPGGGNFVNFYRAGRLALKQLRVSNRINILRPLLPKAWLYAQNGIATGFDYVYLSGRLATLRTAQKYYRRNLWSNIGVGLRGESIDFGVDQLVSTIVELQEDHKSCTSPPISRPAYSPPPPTNRRRRRNVHWHDPVTKWWKFAWTLKDPGAWTRPPTEEEKEWIGLRGMHLEE